MTMVFKRDLKTRGRSPHVQQTRKSYSMLVRDAILTRVKAMQFFSTFNFAGTPALQIQPVSLPYCGVYFIQETMGADGDNNAGVVRFKTMAKYGFSVIVQNNGSEAAQYQLDKAFDNITALFSDHTLYDGFESKIQAFASGMRQHVFGAMGKDNETPVAEMRFELTCDLGVIEYPPYVPDDLDVIHVTTSFPSGGTAQQIHDTQQVTSSYDIDQDPEGS
jgi:hypothetical protein